MSMFNRNEKDTGAGTAVGEKPGDAPASVAAAPKPVQPPLQPVVQPAPEPAPMRSGNAGTFISATTVQGGFFTSALTTVQTSEGSVTVRGTFSAPRGRALAVEDLNKTGLHLCAVGDLDTCLPLAGRWAGTLTATPEATRTFDFEHHGLSNDNLGRWLMAGVILTFIALLSVVAAEVARRA